MTRTLLAIATRRRALRVVAASALGVCGSALAQAPQPAWPARTETLISPCPPGGGVDTVARLLAKHLAPRIGQSVVVDVPTMAEAGLPGYESATNYTLFAPVKTPAAIDERLNREVNAILKEPAVAEKLASLRMVVTGGSTETAVARSRAEATKWAAVIKKGNLQLN